MRHNPLIPIFAIAYVASLWADIAGPMSIMTGSLACGLLLHKGATWARRKLQRLEPAEAIDPEILAQVDRLAPNGPPLAKCVMEIHGVTSDAAYNEYCWLHGGYHADPG